METERKINVRGSIRNLEVNGEPLRLPRPDYRPSAVHTTTASVKADTGRRFSVTTAKDEIVVIRIS